MREPVDVIDVEALAIVQQPLRRPDELARVDRDCRIEHEVRAGRVHDGRRGAPQPPQSGAQAAECLVLRPVEPELARDVGSAEWAVLQCEERDEALHVRRHNEKAAVGEELEAAQQVQASTMPQRRSLT